MIKIKTKEEAKMTGYAELIQQLKRLEQMELKGESALMLMLIEAIHELKETLKYYR